jgi:hypothetical protein
VATHLPEEVRFCFFGLFLFAILSLVLPILLHFLIRQVLLRRSASFYVSRFQPSYRSFATMFNPLADNTLAALNLY